MVHHEAKAPTCTEIGWEAYDTCLNCDYTTYAELSALGHDFSEWTEIRKATLTESGSETHECSRCHIVEEREVPFVYSEQTFAAAMERLSAASERQESFFAVRDALLTYRGLSEEAKAATADGYAQLSAAIAVYNAKAEADNAHFHGEEPKKEQLTFYIRYLNLSMAAEFVRKSKNGEGDTI